MTVKVTFVRRFVGGLLKNLAIDETLSFGSVASAQRWAAGVAGRVLSSNSASESVIENVTISVQS